MSPTTKKILMIGGAAVAGFVAYKVIKGRTSKAAAAAAVAAPQTTKISSSLAAKLAGKLPMTFSKVAGVEEELGVAEDLGSLGGGF
jgi:hypothetical protein